MWIETFKKIENSLQRRYDLYKRHGGFSLIP